MWKAAKAINVKAQQREFIRSSCEKNMLQRIRKVWGKSLLSSELCIAGTANMSRYFGSLEIVSIKIKR